MKKLIIVLACLTVSQFVLAQAKSVYFEIGGPGVASFNFDTRFTKSEKGIGGRAGFGGFSLSYNDFNGGRDRTTAVFIPVGINYLFGNDDRNYFELGAGVTPVIYKDDFSANDNDGAFTATFGHATFGYRLQPKKSGFTFRAAITPIFGRFGFIPYYAGISFGYKF